MLLYSEGASIISKCDEKEGTVKSLCFGSNFKNKKQLYALVCETLKYRPIINDILEKTKLLKQERALTSTSLAQVLLYDLLFGKGIAAAPKKLKNAVEKHQSALKSELARIKVKQNVSKNEDLLSDRLKTEGVVPRYVRVNLLKTTVQDVIDHFRKEDYSFYTSKGLNYSRYVELLRSLQPRQFTVDLHLNELLAFAPKTDLHDHVLYTRGDIIFQDKASCLPAHILAPPPGSHVIDCCAAPGNKTTHAASYMKNQGKIYAFDLDARRLATMGTLTLKAGVLCAELKHQDFLKVDMMEPRYANVRYAIVDPSCSGSGIVSRLNSVTDDDHSSSAERLVKLASFQRSVLTHALSFPSIERVVYSTCSVHHQENEAVVEKVLRQVGNNFQLESVLPGITSRGDSSFHGGEKCLKLTPEKDCTNGFFVACFTKIKGINKTGNVEEGNSVSCLETEESKSGGGSQGGPGKRKNSESLNELENQVEVGVTAKKKKKKKKQKGNDLCNGEEEKLSEEMKEETEPGRVRNNNSKQEPPLEKKDGTMERCEDEDAGGKCLPSKNRKKKKNRKEQPELQGQQHSVKFQKTEMAENGNKRKKKKQRKHFKHKPVTV